MAGYNSIAIDWKGLFFSCNRRTRTRAQPGEQLEVTPGKDLKYSSKTVSYLIDSAARAAL
jgi:hypothetical protein